MTDGVSSSSLRTGARPTVAIAMVLFAAAASFAIYQAIRSPDQESWARDEGIPEIIRLAKQGDYMGAFSLAEKVERLIPKDPELTFESGHIPPKNEVIRESLAWLDRYLGPVAP